MAEKNKISLSVLFNHKPFVIILSLLIAIGCWAAVVFSRNTEMEKTIYNVPIAIPNNASFTSYGLDIMNATIPTVNVKVRGTRAVVGALTSESVIVTPVFIGVTEAGTYDLSLNYAKANERANFEIDSLSQDTVTLQFGTAISNKFSIETNNIAATAADGYVVEKITTDPAEVSITGPEEEVARISHVALRGYTFADELTKSMKITQEIVLYDEYNNELAKENYRIDNTEVDVTVPIYKLGTLPLKVDFINVPDGFDVTTLNYIMSVDEIEVAGVESIIDSRKEISVGYIDLSTLTPGSSQQFEISLQSGLVNRGPETVTVTFPKEGLSSTKITVSDIRLQNVPVNYNVRIVSTSISGVTLIGPEDTLEAMSPRSVVAVVDLSEINIEGTGRRAVAVNFRIPSSNATWVAGSYTVIIEIEAL